MIPSCPECGAKMKIVDGKYGKFYGCNNFPECDGSRSINFKYNNRSISSKCNLKIEDEDVDELLDTLIDPREISESCLLGHIPGSS